MSPEDDRSPTVRLHIWLETEDGMFFGTGRAQLLAGIERHGSLKRAAEELGMSYRAAWGKIRQSEKALGVQLVEKTDSRREGCSLTPFGVMLKERFEIWFDEVERAALDKANEIFPWPARSYMGSSVGAGNTSRRSKGMEPLDGDVENEEE